jgi:hypothetical protein
MIEKEACFNSCYKPPDFVVIWAGKLWAAVRQAPKPNRLARRGGTQQKLCPYHLTLAALDRNFLVRIFVPTEIKRMDSMLSNRLDKIEARAAGLGREAVHVHESV